MNETAAASHNSPDIRFPARSDEFALTSRPSRFSFPRSPPKLARLNLTKDESRWCRSGLTAFGRQCRGTPNARQNFQKSRRKMKNNWSVLRTWGIEKIGITRRKRAECCYIDKIGREWHYWNKFSWFNGIIEINTSSQLILYFNNSNINFYNMAIASRGLTSIWCFPILLIQQHFFRMYT